MTSIDFLNKLYKNLDLTRIIVFLFLQLSLRTICCTATVTLSEDCLTTSYASSIQTAWMTCLDTQSLSTMATQAQPYTKCWRFQRNTGKTSLKLLYTEKFDHKRLVYDITYTSIGAAVVEDFYDKNIVFLQFCFERKLLVKNPLDQHNRILQWYI